MGRENLHETRAPTGEKQQQSIVGVTGQNKFPGKNRHGQRAGVAPLKGPIAGRRV
jgi:hypothetical protein